MVGGAWRGANDFHARWRGSFEDSRGFTIRKKVSIKGTRDADGRRDARGFLCGAGDRASCGTDASGAEDLGGTSGGIWREALIFEFFSLIGCGGGIEDAGDFGDEVAELVRLRDPICESVVFKAGENGVVRLPTGDDGSDKRIDGPELADGFRTTQTFRQGEIGND